MMCRGISSPQLPWNCGRWWAWNTQVLQEAWHHWKLVKMLKSPSLRVRWVRFQIEAGLSLLMVHRKKVILWRLLLFTVRNCHHGSLLTELFISPLWSLPPPTPQVLGFISFMPLMQMEMLCSNSCYFKIACRVTFENFYWISTELHWNCKIARICSFCSSGLLIFLCSPAGIASISHPRGRQDCKVQLPKKDLSHSANRRHKRFRVLLLPSCQPVDPLLLEVYPLQNNIWTVLMPGEKVYLLILWCDICMLLSKDAEFVGDVVHRYQRSSLSPEASILLLFSFQGCYNMWQICADLSAVDSGLASAKIYDKQEFRG